MRIVENFSLPLELQIRYKSDLVPAGGTSEYIPPAGNACDFELLEYTVSETFDFDFSVGAGGSARYYAEVWTSYQGEDVMHVVEVPIDPSTDWTLDTASISGLRGIIIGYTLYIEIVGYRGTLLFDNIRALHSGSNWARDPRCDDITKIFTKGFAIVPPFWIPVSLPTGASFSTVFPPAL